MTPNGHASYTFTLVGGAVDLSMNGGGDGGGAGDLAVNPDMPPPNVVSILPSVQTIPPVPRNGTSGKVTFLITNNTPAQRTPTVLTESIPNGPFTPDQSSTCPLSNMGINPLPAMTSCTLVMTVRTDTSATYSDTFMVTLDDAEVVSFTINAQVTPLWAGENTPGETGSLTAVWGSSPEDIYLTTNDPSNPIWHSSGAGGWNISAPSGCANTLNTIFGTDANHIWAGGSWSSAAIGVICKWSGTMWSAVTLPTGATTIRGIWGSSPTDVYAADDSGHTYHSSDGTSFIAETAAAGPVYALWGADATHVWVAGANGDVGFRDAVIPPNNWITRTTGVTTQLNGMWAEPGTDLYIVGNQPTSGGGGTIVHLNLTTSQPATETPGNSAGSLSAISGRVDPVSHKPDIYAVGAIGNQILHSDGGGTWTQIQINDGNNQAMNGVWVFPNGNVVAVGFNGQIHHLY
jgi:hypothetical protein